MPQETESQASETLTQQLERVEEMIQAGRYETASLICQEVLENYPDSAEAHAAQADVYAAREMWAEAAEWYELAVQLGAGPEVNQRLEHARRRRAAYAVETADEPPRSQLQRQRARLWWIFGGAGAAVLLTVAIVVTGLLSPLPSRPQPRTYPAPPIPEPSVTSISPVAQGPRPVLPSPRPQQPPKTMPQPTPVKPESGPHAPVIITQRMIGPVSDRDYHIARALGSLTWPDGTPMSDAVAVMMDPYTGYAMVTFEIPRALEAEELFAAVVKQSYLIAAATLRTDAGINWLTIRAVATITTPDKEKRTVVAYRANTRRGTLEYWMKLRAEPTVEELWEEVFADSWWNPNVPQDRIK